MCVEPSIPAKLWAEVPPHGPAAILAVVGRLERRIADLEARLGQDSSNSSRPPSSDPIGVKRRPPAALRPASRQYDHERLSALGYLPPWEFYRGNPPRRFEERRTKLSQARHRRRKRNLQLHQVTLPLEGGEAVSSS